VTPAAGPPATPGGDDWYTEIAPPPALADCLVSLWEVRIPVLGAARVRILPNACVDLVLYDSDTSQGEGSATAVAPPHRSFVVGSTLRSFLVRSVGWRHVIGASLRPEGVRPLLGLPAAMIGQRVAVLADVMGAAAGRLEDRVFSGPAEGAMGRLAAALSERRAAAPPPDETAGRAVSLVRRGRGRKRIDALGTDLNLSPRQLERHFLAHVGLSPKLFSRLVRFDRAVRDLPARGTTTWTDFALAHGYSDQAHFINEFGEFAGLSPAAYEQEGSGESPSRAPRHGQTS
jgi:AraC-like DNA-binding protein